MRNTLIFSLLLTTFFLLLACEKKYITETASTLSIGTGDVTGNYFHTGELLSKILNPNSSKHKIHLQVESTDGSIVNIRQISSGKQQLALSQSDGIYHAYYALKDWEKTGAQKKLRSIMSLYSESITLIVSDISGIQEIKDIVGKRITLGNKGSGQLENSREILSAYGIQESDVKAEYLRPLDAFKALRENNIDGIFYTIGHPSANIKNLSEQTKIRIIPLLGPPIDKLLEKFPYYTKSIIPANFYPHVSNIHNIPTISVEATLFTSADIDERLIYNLTKEIHENLSKLKEDSLLYQDLSSDGYLEGLSAPIHSGALQYYQEKKLFNSIPSFLIEATLATPSPSQTN
ncbi:MAG: TAXI family TRAP transporter solute-binding subunit [Oligoflexia bacterium]|nr:TAXI family TRAP transporter solute-binding subunit [Oligoflexia bacterium]